MRWITAGCALALVLIGAYLLIEVLGHFQIGTQARTDETDVTILIGGACVLTGIFVLTVLAVTT